MRERDNEAVISHGLEDHQQQVAADAVFAVVDTVHPEFHEHIDAGIAKTVDSSTHLTAPGMMVGSPLYMSPEQIRGSEIDHRADLYSFGVLLYQMLTGDTPFKADNLIALANQHVLAPVPRLPPGLVRYQPLIDQLLAKEREHRFASADDVLDVLQDIER